MGADTKIEWAHHTFNPWTGCQPVSPACDHCYAEAWAKRSGTVKWGPGEDRRRTTAAYWQQPLKWAKAARAAGTRPRVFCASLADVFDNAVPEDWRADLWTLIAKTPELDWLLLTKRPQNIARMLPVIDSNRPGYRPWNIRWPAGWPNVWLGTTVENQEEADRRIPPLLAVPAARRFLSCEPLLGPVDLRFIHHDGMVEIDALAGTHGVIRPHRGESPRLDLVIAGGETGPGARPMHPGFVRSLRDQCVTAGIPFFFKHWGEFIGGSIIEEPSFDGGWALETEQNGTVALSRCVRLGANVAMYRAGKKRTGRLLDGREWNEMPR